MSFFFCSNFFKISFKVLSSIFCAWPCCIAFAMITSSWTAFSGNAALKLPYLSRAPFVKACFTIASSCAICCCICACSWACSCSFSPCSFLNSSSLFFLISSSSGIVFWIDCYISIFKIFLLFFFLCLWLFLFLTCLFSLFLFCFCLFLFFHSCLLFLQLLFFLRL